MPVNSDDGFIKAKKNLFVDSPEAGPAAPEAPASPSPAAPAQEPAPALPQPSRAGPTLSPPTLSHPPPGVLDEDDLEVPVPTPASVQDDDEDDDVDEVDDLPQPAPAAAPAARPSAPAPRAAPPAAPPAAPAAGPSLAPAAPAAAPAADSGPRDSHRVDVGSGKITAEPTELDFHQRGAYKVGVVGGKSTGKTYYFQSLVWRTQNVDASGALTRYTRGGDEAELYQRIARTGKAAKISVREFAHEYRCWLQLPQTNLEDQTWYRYTLKYPVGLFRRSMARLDLEFLDASGEGLAIPIDKHDEMRDQWRSAFLDARVMIFCLPIWAVFPYEDLSPADLEFRKLLLDQYAVVHNNYVMTRKQALDDGLPLEPVQTILALTMADDTRCRLEEVRERWIKPYSDTDLQETLEKLGTEWGLAQYLDDARAMSEALRAEFRYDNDPEIQAIPTNLRMGGVDPWIVPVSAINGEKLEDYMRKGHSPAHRAALPPPRPAHVELPILLALLQRHNAWA